MLRDLMKSPSSNHVKNLIMGRALHGTCAHGKIGRMYPRRIVCLTEETTETLYLLGEQQRIVGISGFTVRPPQARKEKPRVSAFTSANTAKILALRPDLVLGFSDLQADIAAQLIKLGIDVHIFNQRSVEQILQMICVLGGMVGCEAKAAALVSRLREGLERIHDAAMRLPRRPRVYFEEWDTPQISGIGWVSELVELAGGIDCFPELAQQSLGKNRIIADSNEVPRRAPDIIFGSWCGKKFQAAAVAARAGWGEIPAVRGGELHEIKSPIILQPGPAALTDGVNRMHDIIVRWAGAEGENARAQAGAGSHAVKSRRASR
jgi:iron complex transport system substrate-binding protein